VPLVQRYIDKQFHSLFITRRFPRQRAGRLKCKRLGGAFGDMVSTERPVMPYRSMVEAGIDRDIPPMVALCGESCRHLELEGGESGCRGRSRTPDRGEWRLQVAGRRWQGDVRSCACSIHPTLRGGGGGGGGKGGGGGGGGGVSTTSGFARKNVDRRDAENFADAFFDLAPGSGQQSAECILGYALCRVPDRNTARP